MINIERFEEIMESDNTKWDGDNALQGLIIIAKYFPEKNVLNGADHDIIYSVSVDEIVEAGITEDDAEALRALNWMIQDGDYLACFV